MLPSWILFVSAVIPIAGAWSYIRKVLSGEASPNRVTWSLWATAPLLGFVIEIQEGVGAASIMTLLMGLIPCAVLLASWRNKTALWEIGPFDLACGVMSILGLIVWLASNQPTLGLMAQVLADVIAALPTLRKAFFFPETEALGPFLAGTIYSALTLLTLHEWTTAGVAFPLAILIPDFLIWIFVGTRVGQRWAPRTS